MHNLFEIETDKITQELEMAQRSAEISAAEELTKLRLKKMYCWYDVEEIKLKHRYAAAAIAAASIIITIILCKFSV